VLASQLEEFDRLTRLVNQFLTLALADAGEIALSLEAVDLRQLLERLVEDLGPVAEDRGVSLSLMPGERVAAPADPAWLERLVLNLLDNALKYTPRGGAVRVGASRDGDQAVLEVADTGMGLSAEDRARVFERFYRSERSRAASLPGAGIGLALVRWIAEAHRGSVSVASEEGKGAKFVVRLPLDRQQAAEGNNRPGDPV
jgi:signal transduction histidine kinase